MQFDEMILDAARGIMAASSALVRAANASQRELIDRGKVSRTPLTSSKDGQWSEGLISAARLVAAATHSLVESAQNLVQGVGTEEMLISSAKQVAASTAQLLIACKVKSDPNSETGRRLQAAGNAVIKSTDNLVRAAQRVIDIEEEHILKINTTLVDGMAQEINARSEVLKMEKQLDDARNKLTAIRQAKYRHKVQHRGDGTDGGGGGGSDGDDEPHHSQPQHHYSGAPPTGQPQHYHIVNQTLPNAKPSSPSYLNTSAPAGSFGQTSPRLPQRSHLLLANAVPKPYHSPDMSGISSLPQSPVHRQHAAGAPPVPPPPPLSVSSTFGRPTPPASLKPISPYLTRTGGAVDPQHRANVEACVQDLHQKTFDMSSAAAATASKSPASTTTSSYRILPTIDPRYEKYDLSPVGLGTQNGSSFDTFSRYGYKFEP